MAAIRNQHQRGHQFQAIDRQRERMRMPSGLAARMGELAHMAITDRPGQASQRGHGPGGSPADPFVCRTDLPHQGSADVRAAHRWPPGRPRPLSSCAVHSTTRRWS